MTAHRSMPIRNPSSGFFAFKIKFWKTTESFSGDIELLIV